MGSTTLGFPRSPLEWARRGQQKRLAADFRSAEKAFARARAWRGGCSELEKCEMLSLEASFLLQRMQPRDALALIEEGEQLADLQWSATFAIQRGIALLDAGRCRDAAKAESAAYWRCKAAGRADWSAMAVLNILFALVRDGRTADAREFHALTGDQLRADLPEHDENIDWLRGLMLLGEGQTRQALSTLEGVREVFMERGQRFSATDVLLDVADALSRTGDYPRLYEVAGELIQNFDAIGVPQGVTLATKLLEVAARRWEASVESVARIREARAA